MRFESKVVMVTGATSGIGRTTALAFAREGARVILVGRNHEAGKSLESEIKGHNGEAAFIKADVSISSEVSNAVNQTIKMFGGLDIAFNNAGAAEAPCLTNELSEEEWDRVININLKGTWMCMKNQIQTMLKTGGVIVNMASIYGLVGTPIGLPAYVASKHGIVGLTKSSALEMAKKGIRINAICPGWIPTPGNEDALNLDEIRSHAESLHPMGRLGTQEEVAESVLWLSSESASFITGQAIAVDAGYTAQ